MADNNYSQLIEVFSTEHGTVYQCNRNNNFVVEFAGNCSAFKTGNFLDFTRRVNAINLSEMAKNTSRHADIVILMLHYTERCFVLTMKDVIRLKELLCGAKAMIELNSIVNECLRQYAF